MSKNIILCSDGTGQKGGYGADSNVYKLYEMVDLHSSDFPQITFYDNGVGTSEGDSETKTNKIIDAVSAGFGFGFENNVCDLYHFLARNYIVGDKIYLFGFSRGASTVRACAGFLHHCGLLHRTEAMSDEEFYALMDKALKAYQQRQKKPELAAEFKQQHAIHDATYAPSGDIKIQFVGVWDTVSALGFSTDWSLLFDPILIGLDKLSDQFFPHHYYDYDLNKNIAFAYQALSIDDARKTFKPMIWKESQGSVVEQVWFPGVHSNVGGGYPRTGLSNIAFDWMLTRAEQHGLLFISDDRASVKAHAYYGDRLYDSRDGFGIYYRYQPRDLTALCKDNTVVRIHQSAIERMRYATRNYAPSYIPADFELVATNLDSDSKTVSIPEEDRAAWQLVVKETDAVVAKRRLLYHIFMEMSVFIVFISGWFWTFPPDSVLAELKKACTECGTKTSSGFHPSLWIYDVLHYFTPVYFENILIYVVKLHFVIFVGFAAILIALFTARKRIRFNIQETLEKARALILKNC